MFANQYLMHTKSLIFRLTIKINWFILLLSNSTSFIAKNLALKSWVKINHGLFHVK
jgi:hypothetical protein